MARKKSGVENVHPRLTMPADAWARVERLADVLGLDALTLARVLISVSLVQWENVYQHPERFLRGEAEMLQELDRSAEGLFPEFQGPAPENGSVRGQ